MPNATDEDEEDIWNYTTIKLKGKTASNGNSLSTLAQSKHSNSKGKSQKFVEQQRNNDIDTPQNARFYSDKKDKKGYATRKSVSPERSEKSLLQNQNSFTQEVIDVDLLDYESFSSVKKSPAISSTLKTILKSKASSKKLTPKKSGQQKKASSSKSLNFAQGSTSSSNIHNFFSPKKHPNKRKSSESIDDLKFTDDELMFISRDIAQEINCARTNLRQSSNICILKTEDAPGSNSNKDEKDNIFNTSSITEEIVNEIMKEKESCDLNSSDKFQKNLLPIDSPASKLKECDRKDKHRNSDVHKVKEAVQEPQTDGISGELCDGFFNDSDTDLFDFSDGAEFKDEMEENYVASKTGNISSPSNTERNEFFPTQKSRVKCDFVSLGSCSSVVDSLPRSVVHDNTLCDTAACAPPVTATKQTSLHSFFKIKPGLNAKTHLQLKAKTSHLGKRSNNIFHNVSSRPSLHQSKSEQLLPKSSGKVTMRDISKTQASLESNDYVEENEPQMENGNKKNCPFYKKIPGTSITVDAFRYGVIPGCQAYFLTHFHYDHYGGLTKKFAQPIYCSQVTGNLVESRIGVDGRWIKRLPMWQPCLVAGTTLTLMEANHCPGAVIVLFELKDGRKILHTGDFRACTEMETYDMLQNVIISELYLDTTYCNPSYAFPAQSEVINFVVSLVLKHISDHPSTLIVCGAYTIGKEKIFTAIAKILDTKICVMSDKKKVLECLDDDDLKSRITLDWSKGQVHVLPMGKLNQEALFEHQRKHSHFKTVLAFQPTGWTHSEKMISLENLRPKWSRNGVTLYGVPYSEHSSFLELKRFVQFIKPKRILPTVNNGNPAARQKMEEIFKHWLQDKNATFACGQHA